MAKTKSKAQRKIAVSSSRLVRPLREGVYSALRDYQNGTLEVKCVVAGQLSQELTALYDRLLELIERPNVRMSHAVTDEAK